MIEFLIYDLKVAVLLAVFYMFYRLMLARETFHHVNRIVLLLCHAPMADRLTCVIYNRYGDNPRTHTLIVIQNHQNH